MSEVKIGRMVLAGLAGVSVLGGAAYYLFTILPVKSKVDGIRNQIETLQKEKGRSLARLHELQNQKDQLQKEIERLTLFDLRKEQTFDATFANRSNVGLIALSEILQRNDITIDSLDPGPIDQQKIMVQDQPTAGVLRRSYTVRAQGYYQDVKEAFAELRTLPPALEIDHYDLIYLGADANQAKIAFELGINFNFLVSTEQLDRFAEIASASLAAEARIPQTGLGDMLKGKTLPAFALPDLGQNNAATVSALPTSWWSRMATWLVPPAEAAPARAPGAPVVTQPGMQPVQATTSARTYAFTVGKKVTLGRAEPFLPLTAILAPSGANRSLGIKTGGPLTNIWVMAVLVSGDGPASALLKLGNERIRVQPGTMLNTGAQVAAIGRDFVLIRDQGVLHRVGLRSESNPMTVATPEAPPLQAAPAAPGAPAAAPPPVPVPDIPGAPKVTGQ